MCSTKQKIQELELKIENSVCSFCSEMLYGKGKSVLETLMYSQQTILNFPAQNSRSGLCFGKEEK